MALMDFDGVTYLYDSHCRGPKGRVSSTGFACVLYFEGDDAAKQISSLVHRNNQPKTSVPNDER